MLFVDYSSSTNTITPSILATKRINLGLNTQLCNWILDFLTCRLQSVCMGKHSSTVIILEHHTGAQQGCLLSPLLFTHD